MYDLSNSLSQFSQFSQFEAADTGAAVPVILGAAAGAFAMYMWTGSHKSGMGGLSGYMGGAKRICRQYGRNSAGKRVCRKYRNVIPRS